MNIPRPIKSSVIIFLSFLGAFIIVILFFADFAPDETIYTRSLLATFFAASTALILGYVFGKWWFAFFPVVFPILLLIIGVFKGQYLNFNELITLLFPIIGSFLAVYLGIWSAQRLQNKKNYHQS